MSKKPLPASKTASPEQKNTDIPDVAVAGPANLTQAEAMEKYGILRVPVDYFHLGDFRYTNLADAVSQAKRCAAKSTAAVSG